MSVAIVTGASVRLVRDQGLAVDEAVRLAADRYGLPRREVGDCLQELIEDAE